MADVFLAVAKGPVGFTKLVVVKRLRRSLAEDPEFVSMLQDEARIASRLNHPNVVQTNEFVEADGEFLIAMEYLEGQPLSRVVQRTAERKSHLPDAMHYAVIADVLLGLHHAHELMDYDGTPLGIVHRDVSPQNVFVTYEGQTKIVDFGIAKAVGRAAAETRTGVVKGKFAYMAPEQALGRPVDRRADLFSVGVMLWEAATKRRMWSDLREEAVIVQLATGTYPASPKSVAPDVPAAIDEICVKALAHEPGDRYATAAEIHRDLEAYLADSGNTGVRRALGAFVAELFESRRAEIKAVIERELKEASTGDEESSTLVAPSHSGPVDTAPSANSKSTSRAEERGEPIRPPPARRRAPAAAVVAVGAVLLGAAGIGAWRLRAGANGGQDASSLGCSANAACAEGHGGAPQVCRAGRCVRLLDSSCHRVIGNYKDEHALLLGVVFPRNETKSVQTGIDASVNAIELAIDEISSATLGVPMGGTRRPLAAVVCDTAPDVRAVTKHLVDDLGAWAVMGTLYSKDCGDIAVNVALPAKTMLFCPLSSSPALAALPRQGLVWRTTPQSTNQARAMAALLPELEPVARAAGRLAAPSPVRVVMLVSRSSFGLSMAEIVTPLVRFNGNKSAIDNGRNFSRIDYDDPRDKSDASYVDVVKRIVEVAPHIVIAIGNEELTLKILPALETAWPADAPRPIYELSDLDATLPSLLPFARMNKTLRRRIYGIFQHVPADQAAFDQFALRYRARYGLVPDVDPTAGASSYDATYALAYATCAAGKTEPTGPDLAGGMARLSPPGRRINVGPADLPKGFEILQAGGRIDLEGALTKMDFDASGDTTADFAVWCIGRDDGGDVAPRRTDQIYDPATGALRGALKCK